jgi:hypothetical protein
LYAYLCVFAHSRFVENPPIWSWETNPSFLRWFCHRRHLFLPRGGRLLPPRDTRTPFKVGAMTAVRAVANPAATEAPRTGATVASAVVLWEAIEIVPTEIYQHWPPPRTSSSLSLPSGTWFHRLPAIGSVHRSCQTSTTDLRLELDAKRLLLLAQNDRL